MMHDFYDPVNLQRLHTALPLLHSQLEKILMQIHECWQFLVSDPAPPNEDRILSVLYSGSVVKTKIQAFYNEPISVAELGRCPR